MDTRPSSSLASQTTSFRGAAVPAAVPGRLAACLRTLRGPRPTSSLFAGKTQPPVQTGEPPGGPGPACADREPWSGVPRLKPKIHWPVMEISPEVRYNHDDRE